MNFTEPRCDLHIHSCYSDGGYGPGELAGFARKAGLSAISITDHDTLLGQDEAFRACDENGIEYVSGLELSAYEGGVSLHILGYCVDHRNGVIGSVLHELREARTGRAEAIVRKLGQVRAAVSFEEVLAESKGGAVGRPHIAKVLLRHGFVSSIQEAFNRFIGYGGPCFVPKKVLTLERIFTLIAGAGGVAVWAHPGQNISKGGLLDMVCGMGLRGVEAWHPNHSPALSRKILEIAAARSLLTTGGSDFHFPEAMQVEIGGMPVPYGSVRALKKAAQQVHGR